MFRDGISDTYKWLTTEGCSGQEPKIAETEATNRLVSRERLRISTWRVRYLACLCKNSREAILRSYPHVLGLGFTHSQCRSKNLGSEDGVIRFNGDTDLLVLSAAQWERQIHFLRNKEAMIGVFKNVRNLGLDAGTMWNDRHLQTLDSSFLMEPGAILRSTSPRELVDGDLTDAPGRVIPGVEPNPRFGDWVQACGCSDPDRASEDADWNRDASETPPLRPCVTVCRREPLPVFLKALPNLRTLVLTLMDNPTRRRRNYSRVKKETFSIRQRGKHVLTSDNEDTYSVIAYPTSVLVPNEKSLRPLRSIESFWRVAFPYTHYMSNMTVKIMRPINRTTQPSSPSTDHFLSIDADVPYVYPLDNDPMVSQAKPEAAR